MESNPRNERYPVLEWLLGEIGDEEYIRWLATGTASEQKARDRTESAKRRYTAHPIKKVKDILFWRLLKGEIDDEGFVKGLVAAGIPEIQARAELHTVSTGEGYL